MTDSASHCWWSLFRTIGRVTVIHIDLTPHVEHEASALLWLHENELEGSRNYVHLGARRRFVLCRGALRAILCGNLGCENEKLTFGEHRYGKPFALVDAIPAQISFNVSHSGSHGLIAVAPGGQLGVDVEEPTTRRDFDRLIEAAFGPNEQPDLNLERARGEFQLFFKLWTVKEALIKALGTGLSLDPATFEAPEEIRRGETVGTFRFPQAPSVRWRVEDIGNKEFAAALAFDV